MSKIIVTGGSGQLATCIKTVSKPSENSFVFLDKNSLDITDYNAVNAFFEKEMPGFCVNCAAYTAVDKAEAEPQKAALVNVDGARNLALACAKYSVKLIHISTDFVFDGRKKTPYNEKDDTNPLGVYGQTKLAGEKAIMENLKTYFILRTSWLYSEYGQNFLKTMLRMSNDSKELRVVNDQKGTPTYSLDLAHFIVGLIDKNEDRYGLYHYSNKGMATWFDFALTIFENLGIRCHVVPIATGEFAATAKRPKYSVLETTEVASVFDIQIPDWRESLKKCLVGMRL
ncbi:dTDP-4-dehydrorhamnose reductase [Maribacter sp. 2-571]|uniref:dTDP-4-dehydrorhamnose reductase n=1 Tax=Maribacter sp. 2-571 TaxID=3417569 RepID=UPI003D34D885